jgi:hypothetical protein
MDAEVLFVSLPVAASLGTLLLSQRHERKRAAEERAHEDASLAAEHSHAVAVRLFDQRFQTYFDVLQRARDHVDATYEWEQANKDEGAARSADQPVKDQARQKLAEATRLLVAEVQRATLLAGDTMRTELHNFRSLLLETSFTQTTEVPRITLSGGAMWNVAGDQTIGGPRASNSSQAVAGTIRDEVRLTTTFELLLESRERLMELMSREMRGVAEPPHEAGS